jgi:predicted enzyme related to lactoylglutathione lyase
MAHPIVHVEIPAANQQAAGDFYAKLFGWNIQHMPEMNYSTFAAEGGPGGGFPQVGDMAKPGEVLIYVGTDDIEASLAQAESLGGKTVVPKTEIPGIGWFGIFQDPTGNRMALYTNGR